MTLKLAPAPVRRGRLPGRWRRRDGAPAKRVGLTVWRPSDSTRRSAGRARCGPSASPRHRVRDGRCNCTRRKRCYSRPGPCSKVRPLPSAGSARVVVEHRLARLVQLGIRQSRYFGRAKTRFQLYLAATVTNLTLVAAKASLPADTGGASSVGSALRTGTIRSAFDFVPARLGQILTPALRTPASLPKYTSLNEAFRPDF